MSRLKTYRSIRVSDRLALTGAALLVGSALLSASPWEDSTWLTASSGAGNVQQESVAASHGQAGGESSGSRQRFNISQFLFRRR